MLYGPIAVIPARYNSTRFPGKPLFEIDGISILERTFRQVRQCSLVEDCFIATDDERIYSHAIAFGGKAIMTSKDCLTGTDRIAQAIQKEKVLQECAMIINVQGDEPCIDPKSISTVIQLLLLEPETHVGTLIAPIQNLEDFLNPNVVKVVCSLQKKILYFSRQAIPTTKEGITLQKTSCFRHIGIYAYRPSFLKIFAALPPTPLQVAEDIEMLRALEHEYTVRAAEISQHSPDVNVPKDLEEVQKWIKNQSFSS